MGYSLNSLKGGYRGLYRGYIGLMEKKMETIIWGLGFRVCQNYGPFLGPLN